MDKIQEINQIRRSFANNTMSDHLMLLNIYQEWKSHRNLREKLKFCQENFLNSNHMKMIDKIRNQLKYLIQNYFASLTSNENVISIFFSRLSIFSKMMQIKINTIPSSSVLLCVLVCIRISHVFVYHHRKHRNDRVY